jgi:ABC-type Fe3+ transport system permease subunit
VADRRRVQAVAATVVLGLALALLVLAVALLRSAGEVYGPSGWRWWKDQTSYLILALPVLLAVIGALLARRARRR